MNARELLEQLRIDLKRSIDSIIDEAIQRAESDKRPHRRYSIEIVQQKAVKCDGIPGKTKGRSASLSSQTVSDDEKELWIAFTHDV